MGRKAALPTLTSSSIGPGSEDWIAGNVASNSAQDDLRIPHPEVEPEPAENGLAGPANPR